MASEDMMDKTINAILTAMIGIILLASAFIPTVVEQISTLTGDNLAKYQPLLYLIVTITIISIIIGVIKMYTNDNGER